MSPIAIEYHPHIPVSQQHIELVERKGLGHPDSQWLREHLRCVELITPDRRLAAYEGVGALLCYQ